MQKKQITRDLHDKFLFKRAHMNILCDCARVLHRENKLNILLSPHAQMLNARGRFILGRCYMVENHLIKQQQ